jgi:hypothetical protein
MTPQERHEDVVRRYPGGLTPAQFRDETLASADEDGKLDPPALADWFKQQSLLMKMWMDGLIERRCRRDEAGPWYLSRCASPQGTPVTTDTPITAEREAAIRKLEELIARYWSLAFAEGREGREQDTDAGDAQQCWHDIQQAIRAVAAADTPITDREALAARLRSVAESVRRKPMPLSDFIPLLQQAADALSAAAQPADSAAWGRGQLMVTAAFRYCLGRQTYIVRDCVDWLLTILPRLEHGTRSILRRDLEAAYRDAAEGRPALGDERIDRPEWERLRAALATNDEGGERG